MSANEPVAWLSQGGDVSRSADYFEEMGFKDLIPLYTHPVKQQEPDLYSEDGFPLWTSPQFKELTDEEIMELIPSSDSYDTYLSKEDFVDFARAILRKAQESCNGFCGEYECKENKARCKRKAQEK